VKAQHLEMEAAHKEVVTESGETINPMLHVALHGLVANQVLNNEPPGTWQTVQRLAGLGYDRHNVMHMIMGPVSAFLHQAMTGKQPFERDVFRRQLNELPGDWPSPEEIGRG
jgi:hypothetical protein